MSGRSCWPAVIQFADYFASIFDLIHADLDSGLDLQNLDVWGNPSCYVLWDIFLHVHPEDMDRILAELSSPTANLCGLEGSHCHYSHACYIQAQLW